MTIIEEAVRTLLNQGGPAAAVAVILGSYIYWKDRQTEKRIDALLAQHKADLDAKDLAAQGLDQRYRQELAAANDRTNAVQERRINEQREFLEAQSRVLQASTAAATEGNAAKTELAGSLEDLTTLVREVRDHQLRTGGSSGRGGRT